MKSIFLLFFLCYWSPGFTQLYTFAASSLPADGATGQSMDVAFYDLDGDGDLDLVLANEFQRNTVLTNDGSGNFTNLQNIPNVIHDSEDVAIGDFDQDGDPDLLFCSEDDVIHEYYLNDGSGFFTAHPTFQFPNSTANAVITADLNGDDIPDAIFGNAGQNRIFINNGDGTFTDETSTRLPTSTQTTQDLHLADLDGDGDQDLVVGNEGSSKLLINNGQGVFTDETVDRLPIHPNVETRKISTGDVDGDGSLDLFFSNVAFLTSSLPHRSNLLFVNDGNGFFTNVSEAKMPVDNDDTLDAIFEDVDDDGDQDLVIANVNLQSIANQKVYFNDGSGLFSDQTTLVLGTFYYENALGVIAADLNGDSLKDLYFCERNTGGTVKDLFFTKNSTNSIQNLESRAEQITIFPNPVKDTFRLSASFPLSENMLVELLDHTGRLLTTLEFELEDTDTMKVILQDNKWRIGNYLIRLSGNEFKATKKIRFSR